MNLLDLARAALPDQHAGGTHAKATPAQAAELHALIAIILAKDSDGDKAEALAVALADPDAALLSFRTLAASLQMFPVEPPDERRCCTDCANLTTREHRCLAAWRGEQVGGAHGREYHPVIDLPQRCIGYTAKASELDQHTGAQRWPGLLRGAP